MSLNSDTIHLLSDYNCGNEEINKYFKSKAIEDTQTVTKMYVDEANNQVVCLYSLSSSGYVVQSSNQIYIYPAVEIKYFAVNEVYQDIQYSEDLEDGCLSYNILAAVMSSIYDFTNNFCGADKIILYSVPDAVSFYTNAGFCDFKEFMVKSNHRYLQGCIPMYYDL